MRAATLGELAPVGTDITVDPYPVYAALRDEAPVHRVLVPGSGETWLVLGRDEVRAALADPRLRNDIRHSSSWQDDGGHAIGLNMLQTDGPQHARLRTLVAREFTAGRVQALRPRVQQIADALIDALPQRGAADLVAEYALPLPLTVICELLGVPAGDQRDFRTWSNEIVAPTSAAAAGAAVAEMTGYFAALIRRKSSAPAVGPAVDPGADLMGALVAASAREEGLSPEELLGMAFLLLVAGHETTVNLISGGVANLLRHPDQLAALRADMSLLDGAVEEMLRYEGPVTAAAFRFAAEPVEIGGTLVPAGDSVMLSLAAASRDPRHFPDPDRFDIRRAPRGHLAFGHGVHHCLGAPLARVEGSIALATLLRRLPGLALAGAPDSLTWRSGTMLRGLTELPVRWSARS